MALSYDKIKNHPQVFQRLFGVGVSEFETILSKTAPLWQTTVVERYKRPGRNHKLSLADRILMLLLYYRSYISQIFVGFLFSIDDAQVCRNIKALEPLLAKVTAISKTRHLSQKEVEDLIVDATEQAVERPKRGQKTFYSGKKKRHTVKTEIRVTPQGRIVHVSKTCPGSVHDFALYKEEPSLPQDTRAFVDSGYQGLDKIHRCTELPFKASQHSPLDADDKAYNQALARVRIKVEHVIAQLKTFSILSDRYRNKRKRYNLKFNIIAGIVNLKNGFA
jgi:hypothetical protein